MYCSSLIVWMAGVVFLLSVLSCAMLTTAQSSFSMSGSEPVYSVLFERHARGAASSLTFASLGDYGEGNSAEGAVSTLIHSWNVDFVVALGDNNYPSGSASTIDAHIGKYYHDFIFPYNGTYGPGSTTDRYYPCPGNHDWGNTLPGLGNLKGYKAFFNNLPNYYHWSQGTHPTYNIPLVHFFSLSSDKNEPDGTTVTSVQGAWFKTTFQQVLSDETKVTGGAWASWKIVYFHHPPFSSAQHGDNTNMQWNWSQWPIDLLQGGHDHTYERIVPSDGLTYLVNGAGGSDLYSFTHCCAPGSVIRYNSLHGAMLFHVNTTHLDGTFITVNNQKIDTFTLTKKSADVAAMA